MRNAWKKGQSGNPRGRPTKQHLLQQLHAASGTYLSNAPYRNVDEALLAQSREKQADDLRQGAYYIAKRCELRLHRDLDIDAKNLWDSIRAWGTAADKVLMVAEASGLSLHVPSILLEKFFQAIQSVRNGPSDKGYYVNSGPGDVTAVQTNASAEIQHHESHSQDALHRATTEAQSTQASGQK